MCMKQQNYMHEMCTYTGILIKDGSYVTVKEYIPTIVTFPSLSRSSIIDQCRPFGTNSLFVSLSSNPCSGIWTVKNPSPNGNHAFASVKIKCLTILFVKKLSKFSNHYLR